MVKKILFLILFFLFAYSCSDSPTDSDNDPGDIKDPGAIRIGLMYDVPELTTLQRLDSLATNSAMLNTLGIKEFTVSTITSDIDPDSLQLFTIIYLPVSWASSNSMIYENILAAKNSYMDYIQSGGAFFIEQPNPYNRPSNMITIDFLPYPVTLSNGYLNEDVVIVDSTHYITNGIDPINMPFPGDQVQDLPEEYSILAEGVQSGAPSVFYLNHGNGKILFAMGNPSPSSIHPYSDEVYYRMLIWLTLQD